MSIGNLVEAIRVAFSGEVVRTMTMPGRVPSPVAKGESGPIIVPRRE
jgi:hypothetical protein